MLPMYSYVCHTQSWKASSVAIVIIFTLLVKAKKKRSKAMPRKPNEIEQEKHAKHVTSDKNMKEAQQRKARQSKATQAKQSQAEQNRAKPIQAKPS